MSEPAATDTLDPELATALPEIERKIAEHVEQTGTPGLAFGIVRAGGLAWSKGFGYADYERDEPPNADTLFRVGSITKTFTATALVQLRDAGKLGLDDPLTRYLPEFAAAHNPFGPIEQVTLRRLVSHHAGLVGEPPLDHWVTLTFPSMAEIVGTFDRVAVAIPPDSAFKYSNLAFALLGEVVSRVSGTPYERYISERILAPLGMTSSTFAIDDTLRPRLATGYGSHPLDDRPEPTPHPLIAGMSSAGQLYSTVNDLARWIALQLTARPPSRFAPDEPESPVLRRASLFEMQQPLYLEADWSVGYGISWISNRRGDNVYPGHSGGIHGFLTRIAFNVPHQVGVIALSNGQASPDPIAFDVLDAVVAATSATATPSGPPPATPPAWRPLLGVYVSTTLGATTLVECRRGRLQLRIPTPPGVTAPPPSPLHATDEERVFLVEGGRYAGEPLRFSTDATGAIDGLTVNGFRLDKRG